MAGTGAAFLATLLEAAPSGRRPRFCAFDKPLQFLNFTETADAFAMRGFRGLEIAVRAGGHVSPRKVEDDLPAFHEALQRRRLEITIIATDINSVESAHAETVLRAAAQLGIRYYRLQWFRYDLRRPLLPQLDAIAAKLPALADLTRELKMTAIYQNHSGPAMVGAPIWDIYRLLKDYDPRVIGLGFDIHHATIEGGLSWPIQWKLAQPNVAAIYVKDFIWQDGKVKDVPLGEGQVDHKFFPQLRQLGFVGPICLHVEYLEGKKNQDAIVSAFGKDLYTLQSLLRG